MEMQKFISLNYRYTDRINTWKTLLYSFVGLFLIIGLANCSGKQAATEPPKTLIQNFIAQKDTMVNPSLSDFYVKEEQAGIAEEVNKAISAKEAAGTIEKVRNATYDFSGLEMKVIDQTKYYVNYEPKKFMKVAVKGNYTMQLQESSKIIPTDKIITLELVDKDWKVTEQLNPWG
jgi:hypothetical protein